MVEARALRGLEFDGSKVELGRVVAPPFDVINEKDLVQLHKEPYNVTHLTRPKKPRRSKEKDAYAYANQLLEEWIAARVLNQAPEEAVYAYEMWYKQRHQERRMRGVLLNVRLDPTYRQIVPHERTFEKPAEDRLNLLRATAADLEPIWLLYSGKSVEETLWAYIDGSGEAPTSLVTAKDGTIHKLWRVVDVAVAGTMLEGLKGRKAYIADGHHRYATALKYAEERRMREYRPPKNAPYEYKLIFLTNMNDSGLGILPTHRVVKQPKKIDLKELRERLTQDFAVTEVRGRETRMAEEILTKLEAEAATGGQVLALYAGGPHYWILRANAPVLPEALAPGRSFTWRSLGVAFLQKLVLEKHVGIPEKKWGDDVYYTRDEKEAVAMVEEGKACLAVFHTPTRLAQLRAIADGGEVMPPKSTYFAPKPLSGLVMHRIGHPAPVVERRRVTS